MIKMANIDFVSLPDEDFDHPLVNNRSCVIWNHRRCNGSCVRTAYEVFTGKTLERLDFKEVRGFDGIRTVWILTALWSMFASHTSWAMPAR